MSFAKLSQEVQLKEELQIACKLRQLATYRLYGIVHHFGNINNGHYIAEVADLAKAEPAPGKDKDSKGAKGVVWYECDDDKVKSISGPTLKSNTAYLLFFWRTSSASVF